MSWLNENYEIIFMMVAPPGFPANAKHLQVLSYCLETASQVFGKRSLPKSFLLKKGNFEPGSSGFFFS